MKLKLSTKAAMLISLTVFVAVGSVIGALVYTWQMRQTINNLISKNVTEMLAASELDIALLSQRGFVAFYMLDNGNDRWLHEINNLKPVFKSKLEAFEKRAENPDERELLVNVGRAFGGYDARRDEVVQRYKKGDLAEAKRLYFYDLDTIYRETAKLCDAVVETNKKDVNDMLDRNTKQIRRFTWMVALVISLICVMGAGLIWLLVSGIFNPIREAAAEVRSTTERGAKQREDIQEEEDLNLLVSYLRLLMSEANDGSAVQEQRFAPPAQSEQLAAIGKTVAQVAHEIKNRLVIVGGFARSIEKRLGEEENGHKARIIREEVDKLENMVGQITDFSKPVRLDLKTHSLNHLVEELLSKFPSQELQGVTVGLSLDPHLPQVMIDAERIEQVIINIVRNAREAIGAGASGAVRVSTRVDERGAALIIEDNGQGMPEAIQNRVFEPFFTTKKKGSGLGLSICRQIVAEHGGLLEFESCSEKGTVFRIIFPIA